MKTFICLCLVVLASASTNAEFWKGTVLDSTVEKMRSSCEEDDTIACFQYKALSFLDSILHKDYLQLTGGRSDESSEISMEDFLKGQNAKFNVPLLGSLTVDARSLENEELNFKMDFGSGENGEARKKSKLKKIFIPILVFVLLKAMTLVPLALGVLGLKAWNGLQLAFFSFIISAGLAIFQLCQKLAADGAHAHISAAPAAWDPALANYHVARNIENDNLPYSAYV